MSLTPAVSLKGRVSLNAEVALNKSNTVSLVWMGHRTHFCRRFPMKSCRPTRANTARAKTVRIITSTIFFTAWIRAPTMVFKPDGRKSKLKTKSEVSNSQVMINRIDKQSKIWFKYLNKGEEEEEEYRESQ